MAKRFIDTNTFSDEWVGGLSKDSKLFFMYYITKCDHAGMLKLNRKLCEFETGLTNIDTLIEEFKDSLIRVGEEYTFFMPRFIKFQYPDFPKSKVAQQEGALKILKRYGLWLEKECRLVKYSEELGKS